MHLKSFCLKRLLWVNVSILLGGISFTTHAVTLNFSASLVQGTCSLSLDKSVLSLGEINQVSLRSGALVNLQLFTLTVGDCNGQGSMSPKIFVMGTGDIEDGKWLFRSIDSDVGGAGVMLVQSATQPNYATKEVKSGDVLPLAAAGQGSVKKALPFFAGVSCGTSAGCATVKPGKLTANVMFLFGYQ